MTKNTETATDRPTLELSADVLVIGGGPAATWAALAASRAGARVILVDKGYCGTSGATAPSNTGAWYLPDEASREAEIEKRLGQAEGLAERDWLHRVMVESCRGLDELGAAGYPFPLDDDGSQYRANLRGPDYMNYMRRRVKSAGVVILDHHPALELLWADGVVAGAAGQNLRTGQRYRAKAGAVVVATGGCTFLSRALGCDGNTGDGYLMAAEAGARLSGMEFSARYGLAAAHSSVTKGMTFRFASFFLEDGSPLPDTGEDRITRVARAMVAGERVYALMDKGTEEQRDWLKRGQPNCFLAFERIGLDPFSQRFPVTLRSEGTVRGVGGLDLVGDRCATTVPGLFAAGDAASRERLVGARSGGGSPNASWAIASGVWSGQGAAEFARRVGDNADRRRVIALGQAGLRPRDSRREDFGREVVQAVQRETLPLDVNLFRRGERIEVSQTRLESVWREVREHLKGEGRQAVKAREAAAMTATARWIWASAAHRNETRGLNLRVDRPALDDTLTRHVRVSGTDELRVEIGELKEAREVAL